MKDRTQMPLEGPATPIPSSDTAMQMHDQADQVDRNVSIPNHANERRDAVLKALEVISYVPTGTKKSKGGHASAERQWRLL